MRCSVVCHYEEARGKPVRVCLRGIVVGPNLFERGNRGTAMKIVDVRAYVVGGADQGADYHAQSSGHWITSTVIATPMSKYPEYQKTRESFGIGVLGTTMVEVEAEDGTIGFAVTTGNVPAAYLIEHHFKRFVVGKAPDGSTSARSGADTYGKGVSRQLSSMITTSSRPRGASNGTRSGRAWSLALRIAPGAAPRLISPAPMTGWRRLLRFWPR